MNRVLRKSALVSLAMLLVPPDPVPAGAQTLTIVAGEKAGRLDFGEQSDPGVRKIVRLDKRVTALAAQLVESIDRGQIDEEGQQSPAELEDFSRAVLEAVPDIFGHKAIEIISDEILPVELAGKDGIFVGDAIPTSHQFAPAHRKVAPREVALSSYVIEAAMPMPEGSSRVAQDIVQVALGLERELAIELRLNPARDSLQRMLARIDVSILHIDTHGDEKGRGIQTTYAGDIMPADAIPVSIQVPLILLFGCEGFADSRAFGAVLRQRGAEAVISSFAKFQSFNLTGDPSRERRVYDAFFAALRSGADVGTALVRLRRAAKDEATAGSQRTLTRHFFLLLGNQRLQFRWPSSRG